MAAALFNLTNLRAFRRERIFEDRNNPLHDLDETDIAEHARACVRARARACVCVCQSCADPEGGGQGVRTPPEKSQK